MPLQNRVDPFGNIFASSSRGTWTGNRGVIHQNKKIVNTFKNKFWITCSLKYKDFQRTVMTEKRWTELFFLDEATAFSAGHRPCGFCRYQAFKSFKNYWLAANEANYQLPNHSIKSIDRILHQDRLLLSGEKNTFVASLSDLPNGSFVKYATKDQCCLLQDGYLLLWDAFGYQSIYKPEQNIEVEVLTPRTMVEVLKAGYLIQIHESAHLLLRNTNI